VAASLSAAFPAAVAVPKPRSGWGRAGHRRAVLAGAVVIAVVVGGAVAAWAAESGGSAGYRMGTVTRSDVDTTLTVVGNVEPVSDASASFQVAGQVATVAVTPGQSVTAGQTLGTLDTTALSEAVSSAESTVHADEAKLTEDEDAQTSSTSTTTTPSSGTSSASPSGTAQGSSSPSTSTTVPSAGGTGIGQNAQITQDQKTLTQDEATLDTDQQKEAAVLAQAQTDCTSANTATPAGQATCEAALQTVSADEQQVSKDQNTVSKDELALQQALLASSNGSGGSRGGNAGSNAQTTAAVSASSEAVLTADITGNSGSGTSGSGASGSGLGTTTSGASGGNSDSPEQIASDQAAIDTAEAQLINDQQSLNSATLSSPISGTVVSVGITAGDTVSADSSTETITLIGTNAYEAQATLDSSQVPSVNVGQSASVEVDGVDSVLQATVAQVGPVESTSSGFSYPVLVALPASGGTMHAGSAADITISTGKVSDVVAVPTSALQTLGSRTFVLVLSKGELTRKMVTVGMVGDEYTQVRSGLTPGESVVLADYGEAVPSSSTNTVGVGGLLGGGGGVGGFFGSGRFAGGGGGGFFQRTAG
jgi:trimeric autotransporter adhesin